MPGRRVGELLQEGVKRTEGREAGREWLWDAKSSPDTSECCGGAVWRGRRTGTAVFGG